MPRSRVHAALVLLSALCAGAASCADGGSRSRGGALTGIDPKWAIPPASIAIHPLTRVGADSAGDPALLLYLEVHDEFGQTIKALGRIRVELYRPGSSRPAPAEAPASPDHSISPDTVQPRDQSWDVDLTEPERNARMFDDLVTRTYTLPLGGLPSWLTDWSRAQGGGANAPTVIVTFTYRDQDGVERILRSGYRISR